MWRRKRRLWRPSEHARGPSVATVDISSGHPLPFYLFLSSFALSLVPFFAFVLVHMSFFKQFYASVTKSDYRALREGFIMRHCPTSPNFNFHKYMMRALEDDFKRVVGISWYLWLFVVIFLLLNVHDLAELLGADAERPARVKPSDEHFWFNRPGIMLYLIHFILFQNAFEIAFFFWIWSTYGFNSCIMESVGYLIPRLVFGVMIQVLCSYSTLPLYAIVTQMGDMFKRAIFAEHMQLMLHGWVEGVRKRKRAGFSAFRGLFGHKNKKRSSSGSDIPMQRMTSQVPGSSHNVRQPATLEGTIASSMEISQVQDG
ncbi:putative MLO-like protein 13 [Cocos nucifera]|uniref:Putative MLO-like protein 13 n=1 Tax=Cocos nucifera TaxID=13894 RepID=A0A8K0HUU2_COCNU|nr:putative MLO-like protein 13 [Cocos nucifera]